MIDKLIAKIKDLNSPIVVGLDPRLSQIPDSVKSKSYSKFGKSTKAVSEIFYDFNTAIIDHIYDLVPAVKPQISLYEQLGPDGIECYIKTIAYAKSKGLIVIGDIKRGDIADTAVAYSNGHIGMVEIECAEHEIFGADFITVNPYLGYDSVEPFLANCKQYSKGIFVLVKTSNPSSSQIQDLLAADGRPIYAHVGDLVSEWGRELIGKYGFSQVGAVVGATHPKEGTYLREKMPHTFFLVPGYGAQGATAKDLKGLFNKDGLGAIVNSSRGITAAFQSEKYKCKEEDFAEAAREAVLDMKKDLGSI